MNALKATLVYRKFATRSPATAEGFAGALSANGSRPTTMMVWSWGVLGLVRPVFREPALE